MKIAFVDKPTIDFSLKLIGGDINTIPFVANSLRHLITNSLVDLMVWPQKIWVPLGETWERENANISGLLKIGIQSAEELVSGTNVLERGVSAMTSFKSFKCRIEPEEREEKIHRSERRTVAGVRGTD